MARTSDEIKKDIQGKFGFVPPFFEPAFATPGILENLWQQTLTGYVENPLPDLFKEKLAALISRYCSVPYCLICHSSTLRPLGMKSEDVFDLLQQPPLTYKELAEKTNCLNEVQLKQWPESGSHLEECILYCCVAVYLGTDSENCLEKLRQMLTESDYNYLVLFIAYNKTALTWAEGHPELSYQADQRYKENFNSLISEEPGLKNFFDNYSVLMQKQEDSRLKWLTNENKEFALKEMELRKNLEAALEETKASESQFRQISDGLSLMIWIADAEGCIYWSNAWWYDYTGVDHLDWTGENSPMHPDDIKVARVRWMQSISDGTDYNIETRFKRKSDNAYRWHLVKAVAIRDQNGHIMKWVGSSVDIENHKLLVTELELEKDLREKFVAALTHDLRTPLTAAKMSGQLLDRKVSDDLRKLTSKIINSMDRADHMIKDLLDAGKIKSGEKFLLNLKQCNLNTIVTDTIEDLSTVHGNRFQIMANQQIEGIWDGEVIRRILENLANNAVKYGSIESPIIIRLSSENRTATFSVHNKGNPISPDELSKLFVAYRRSESASTSNQKGWGIGLTLVKGFSEALGGQVKVTSSLKEGTEFTVTLPLDSGSK